MQKDIQAILTEVVELREAVRALSDIVSASLSVHGAKTLGDAVAESVDLTRPISSTRHEPVSTPDTPKESGDPDGTDDYRALRGVVQSMCTTMARSGREGRDHLMSCLESVGAPYLSKVKDKDLQTLKDLLEEKR